MLSEEPMQSIHEVKAEDAVLDTEFSSNGEVSESCTFEVISRYNSDDAVKEFCIPYSCGTFLDTNENTVFHTTKLMSVIFTK